MFAMRSNDFCWDLAPRGGRCKDSHTDIDHERSIYNESGVPSGGWCDADPVSMRDCKAPHIGG